MSDFKGRHFGGEIVLWAVRWYCRYPISCPRIHEEVLSGSRQASPFHQHSSPPAAPGGRQDPDPEPS